MKALRTARCPKDTQPVSRRKCPFLSVFFVNNMIPPGHRPVDPCLSRRVSQGHLAGVLGIFLSYVPFPFLNSSATPSGDSRPWWPPFTFCSLMGDCFADLLFIHGLFPQQEGSFRPFTHSLGNHGRMLHSFTPFTRIHSFRSQE